MSTQININTLTFTRLLLICQFVSRAHLPDVVISAPTFCSDRVYDAHFKSTEERLVVFFPQSVPLHTHTLYSFQRSCHLVHLFVCAPFDFAYCVFYSMVIVFCGAFMVHFPLSDSLSRSLSLLLLLLPLVEIHPSICSPVSFCFGFFFLAFFPLFA